MSGRVVAEPPVIPGLVFVDVLGMGGFADVFRYEQLGRHVAVKVLTTDLSRNTQQAFEAEANLMARLSTHPAIVSIYQAGAASDGRSFLVMEVCQPKHLGARLRQKTFAVGKALEVTVQIAGAVESAHRLGVLHRDIKPANILFTEFGRPALTDFGISVSRQDGEQGLGVGVSPAWAPPEQLRSGAPMGPASDVYSLAATCWAMLVGRSPFETVAGPNDALSVTKRVRQDPVPPTRREGVPESLERVLAVAMAKDPSHRYASALEFGRALQAVQTSLHLPSTPIEVGEDTAYDDLDDDEGEGSTRISSFKIIDPDGAPEGRTATAKPSPTPIDVPGGERTSSRESWLISAPSPTAAATGVRDFTGPGIPSAALDVTEMRGNELEESVGTGEIGEPSVAPERPQRSRLVMVAVAALALMGVGLGVSAVVSKDVAGTTDERPPQEGSEPGNPVGPKNARVAGLQVQRQGEKVVATWRNPSPEPGDQFLYRLVDPAKTRPYSGPTTATQATVKASPGRACVEVQLVRENGQPSEAVTSCTKQ